MKFIELKSSLKDSVAGIYSLEGDDRFVLINALELIEKKIDLKFPDMNKTVFNNEAKYTLDDIISSASALPFGDEKRIVVVWDTALKANDYQKFEKFIAGGGAETTHLVFLSSTLNEFCRKMKNISLKVSQHPGRIPLYILYGQMAPINGPSFKFPLPIVQE